MTTSTIGERLGVAVIGTGAIAQQAHLPAWRKVAKAEVLTVVDRDEHRAREVAERWGIPRWHRDYRQALDDPDVEALDVCVPPALHAEIALAALKAGRHVLLEKPITIRLDEGRQLVAAARAASSTLMVAENWPFASATRRAQHVLDAGTVGEPFLLRAHHESDLYTDEQLGASSWLADPEIAGRGYLMQAGIHTLNLARFLLGEIDSVYALALPISKPIEHTAIVTARFESGALGSMTFTGRSRHLGERRLEFKLFGPLGVVEFDIWSGRTTWTANGERTVVEVGEPSRGFAEELDHFVTCVRRGEEPLTSASDQLRTLAVVHAAYRSLDADRTVQIQEILNEHE